MDLDIHLQGVEDLLKNLENRGLKGGDLHTLTEAVKYLLETSNIVKEAGN